MLDRPPRQSPMLAPRDVATVAPTLAKDTSKPSGVAAHASGAQAGEAVGAPQVTGYTIEAPLGVGGMGTVWRATQHSTRRQVALKLLAPGLFGSRRARDRFVREVELAARLKHPHIGQVYDSGVHQGSYYYAMELIDGSALDEYVGSRNLSERQVLELMATVCDAVQHAHQRGIIHRDLKPSNIIVSADGQPHILDFGIAKAVEGEEMQLSLDGEICGTPAYMSPEQAAGKHDQIDTRSDVYSLGVILFRLITGTFPHNLEGSHYQVLRRIAEEEVKRPRSISRQISGELESLLLKALARDPEERYSSAGALAQDIRNYLNHEPLAARPTTVTYFLQKKLARHRIPAGIAGVVLVASLAALAWMYNRPTEFDLSASLAGSTVYINGELYPCMTPCIVPLGRGEHEIKVVPPGDDHQPAIRNVVVSWGRAYGDVSEPINLLPAFEYCNFTSDPPRARVQVRSRETRAVVHEGVTPLYLVKVPIGQYDVVFSKDGYGRDELTLEIYGSTEQRAVEWSLTPLVSAEQ